MQANVETGFVLAIRDAWKSVATDGLDGCEEILSAVSFLLRTLAGIESDGIHISGGDLENRSKSSL